MRLTRNSQVPVSISLEAVVIRADGTREPLGEVAYWHKDFTKRLVRRFKNKNVGRVRLTDNKE